MDKQTNEQKVSEAPECERKAFAEPKLTYVKPKLSKQGKVSHITQSFFGSFSP